MGQTLTHGVYLPDEGERNCYAGLAANWQLLDGAVGTVAEHTTALAGKANAVHTHTKADITDFPAYGNAAGTICEGNDSRLSDARTPVAHTHTKADVTDLLNSNFIPSANNSYDLGSSSYQWNNLYAKRVNTQSVNGVNPGALSLPTTASSNIDTTNWNLRGGYICNITHTVNCYICVQIQRSVDFGIWAIGVGRQTFRAVQDGSGNYLVMVCFPCIVGVGVMLYSVPLIDTPAEDREPDLNIQVAKYFPCQGNV